MKDWALHLSIMDRGGPHVPSPFCKSYCLLKVPPGGSVICFNGVATEGLAGKKGVLREGKETIESNGGI